MLRVKDKDSVLLEYLNSLGSHQLRHYSYKGYEMNKVCSALIAKVVDL